MPDFSLPHVAAQLLGSPLLIHPQKLANILAAVGPRITGQADWSMMIEAEQVEHRSNADYVIADGIAIIPVIGSLRHRGMSMNSSGMTAYQALDMNLTLAANDSSVHSILLDVDSPGGQVAGAFNLAARIRQISQTKKIVAVAADMAASAGYLLASAASEVVVTRTGEVGSIGVVMAHVDYSQELAKQGRAVTYIYAGAHKVDGNPFAPLPEGVKANLQSEIENLYQLFTAHVGEMRGIGQATAAATEARMYMGQAAIDAGLADRIGSLESEFQRLKTAKISGTRGAGSRRFATRQRSNSMTTQTSGGEPTQTATPQNTGQTTVLEITQAELDVLAEQAHADGVSAERDRIINILAVGNELGISASVTDRMIGSGQSSEHARALMTVLKQDMQSQAHINPNHAAGTEPKNTTATVDTQAIYAARKGVR